MLPLDKIKFNEYQNAKHQHLSVGTYNVIPHQSELMETSLDKTESHEYLTAAICSESTLMHSFIYLTNVQ